MVSCNSVLLCEMVRNLEFSRLVLGRLVRHKRSQLLESMTALLANPWFERVWTLQEVAFARKCMIICGQSKVDWETFGGAYNGTPQLRASKSAENLFRSRWWLYLSLRDVSPKQIALTRDEDTAETELELLAGIRNMKATVPHDRVYSLYSVFRAIGISLPSPNYRKDIAEVFREVTIAYIRNRQSLDIITITTPPKEGSGYPSWVPDWLTPSYNNPMLIWKLADYDAKRPRRIPTVTEKTGYNKLGVMGKYIGKIKETISCPLIGDSNLDRSQAWQNFMSSCLRWRRLIDNLDVLPSGNDPRPVEKIILRAYHTDIPRSGLQPWYHWAIHGGSQPPSVDGENLRH